MTRALFASMLAALILIAFFLGDALGLTPLGLALAFATAASAAFLAGLSTGPGQPAPPDVGEKADPLSGPLPNPLPEELAERYYANFLMPLRNALMRDTLTERQAVEPASQEFAMPERIQVLIPDTPSIRSALRDAVQSECRSVAIAPNQDARQFGIYLYSRAPFSAIVDVPTILHGPSSSLDSGRSARELYDRFADRLTALVERPSSERSSSEGEPSEDAPSEDPPTSEGLPVRVYRNVRSFPLSK